MKKILFLFALIATIKSSAQEELKPCATTEKFKLDIQNNPQYLKNKEDLEDFTRQFIKNAQVQRTPNAQIRIIPVVFHILHQYGSENISDAQVIDAVDILTRDYRKRNADTVDIVPDFVSIAADCEIEFRLATLDPNGNCTNGIDRIVTPLTNSADDDSKLNPWPNDQYLNIWTASSLGLAGAAAYAQYPGGWDLKDGVMCTSNYVGSIGSSNDFRSRVLTHEVGHYLNLSHVWGNSNSPGVNCGDDGVSDTPISIGWSQCILTGSYCNPPVIENVQNYMEYSYCDRMFTLGQKARMIAALNSTLSNRNNLWSPSNLTATGTDGSPVTVCSPIADFTVDYINACAGTPIKFIDQSWKAPLINRSWSFPGGTPSTSTDSTPLITYSATGIYNATLVVTSTGGTDSITKNSVVRITGTPMRSMPFNEDFESPTSFPGLDGYVENPDNSTTGTWSLVSNANTTPTGTHALKMSNFSNINGEVDSWISPSIDLTNWSFPITLSFEVAYAQRNSTSDDELRIFYSINCGKTWLGAGYNKSGATLATAGITSTNFTPANPSLWRLETTNVNPVQNKPSVRFKFQNTSTRGNNIFIDDINITGNFVSIDETDGLQNGLLLYPNPTNGTSNVSFKLNKSEHVTVDIKNILGQSLLTLIDKNLSQGDYEYTIPVLAPGIYFVDVMVNNKHHVQKLVVS